MPVTDNLRTLAANMRHAARNGETVTIGGGKFGPAELKEGAEALVATPFATRMWINQPSTLQPHHALHGTNVLAFHEYGDTMLVYFLSGAVVSMQMPRMVLSEGWTG
jgi:hypothetical protein